VISSELGETRKFIRIRDIGYAVERDGKAGILK
jgi:hypothetical protein